MYKLISYSWLMLNCITCVMLRKKSWTTIVCWQPPCLQQCLSMFGWSSFSFIQFYDLKMRYCATLQALSTVYNTPKCYIDSEGITKFIYISGVLVRRYETYFFHKLVLLFWHFEISDILILWIMIAMHIHETVSHKKCIPNSIYMCSSGLCNW